MKVFPHSTVSLIILISSYHRMLRPLLLLRLHRSQPKQATSAPVAQNAPAFNFQPVAQMQNTIPNDGSVQAVINQQLQLMQQQLMMLSGQAPAAMPPGPVAAAISNTPPSNSSTFRERHERCPHHS
jgi:hypothetical protein